MTPRAIDIHGLTEEVLEELQAKKWTKGLSEMLANFLNGRKDFPIVVHNEYYDHWKVLKPAFDRVGNSKGLPKKERWRCTKKLAKQKLTQDAYFLDAVLESCGMEPRDGDECHDA